MERVQLLINVTDCKIEKYITQIAFKVFLIDRFIIFSSTKENSGRAQHCVLETGISP